MTTNVHEIFCSFIWQGDYYYSDILFSLFVRNNHHVVPDTKLPETLDLKVKVILLAAKWYHFENTKVLNCN